MKETVLLYNFTDRDRILKLTKALMPLGFRLKPVDKSDYLKPVGILAGVKGMEENGALDPYDGPDFSDEMVLMAGFTSAQVDAFIKALRKTGVGRIDYKAVLTETNRNWDSLKLYKEIRKEHEAVNR